MSLVAVVIAAVAAAVPQPQAHHHHHHHYRRHHHKRHRPKPLSYAVASWYDDYYGQTASGWRAYYGVANKFLRFGTRIVFVYRGRSITATVDDRGPYVYGRDFDLNQNTARSLGFGGVATVGYRIVP